MPFKRTLEEEEDTTNEMIFFQRGPKPNADMASNKYSQWRQNRRLLQSQASEIAGASSFGGLP
jgi:hypothetical protein